MLNGWLERHGGGVIGALLGILSGLAAFLIGGDSGNLVRLGYDLPFALRGSVDAGEVVVVYLDEESHRSLNQPFTSPWDRSLHARLLDVLRAGQAKVVAFDILFTDPNPAAAAADQALIRSVRAHGKVVSALNVVQTNPAEGTSMEMLEVPFDGLMEASGALGSVGLERDADLGIRRHTPARWNVGGMTEVPSIGEAAARLAMGKAAPASSEKTGTRWIRYYGPAGQLRSLSYAQVLEPQGFVPGFFRDKVVFVGGKLSSDFSGKGKDEFGTVHTRWDSRFSPGVEIHATQCANLLRGDWLERLPNWLEGMVLVLTGGGLGFGLVRLRPLAAAGGAVAAGIVSVLMACSLVWFANRWWGWLAMAGVQVPVVLGWCWVHRSFAWYAERRVLVESLSLHISPGRARQLLHHPELMKPGAKLSRVSILFTDISNYSLISESTVLDDLDKMLNSYFEKALAAVHETDGTVIKLIGDAIFAVWNAPEPQEGHEERACRTAIRLHEQLILYEADSQNSPLRTRAGLHCGEALVGNFGSSRRFDYTVMGGAVNLASRLEGLNKHLGTAILASREFQKPIEDKFVTRQLGTFRLKGIGRPVQVYEILGGLECKPATQPWRDAFAGALRAFKHGDFPEARRGFESTLALRPDDGPSRFYLKELRRLGSEPPDHEWTGAVNMDEK